MTLVVALMYVVTTSTSMLHALAHAPRALAPACAGDLAAGRFSPLGDDRVAAAAAEPSPATECFFCHHGPAVAMQALPGAAPDPTLAPATAAPTMAVQPISAVRAPLPSLRAPPFLS